MADRRYTVPDPRGGEVVIVVRRDRRLKKSARWVRQPDGALLLRVPHRLPDRQIGGLLDQVAAQAARRRRRAAARSDAGLQARAEMINRLYFGGKIEWASIRWVGNMQRRLGSCTNGGPTDGHIRISDRIKSWPQWVIDYVIAHELAHRVHPDHSPDFWEYLSAAYPLTERARGFIAGAGFAQGESFGEEG